MLCRYIIYGRVGTFAKSDCKLRHDSMGVRLLSVRVEQLCSHWMDFHEIWYLNIFRNLAGKLTFN